MSRNLGGVLSSHKWLLDAHGRLCLHIMKKGDSVHNTAGHCQGELKPPIIGQLAQGPNILQSTEEECRGASINQALGWLVADGSHSD